MKVQLKPVTFWEVSVNGIALGTLQEVSRWEGWMKLQEPATKQVMIVDAPSSVQETMASIEAFGTKVLVDVLKLSPSLLEKIPEDQRKQVLHWGIATEVAP